MNHSTQQLVKLYTYCDLNFNTVKGGISPEIEMSVYAEKSDEPLMCTSVKIDDLLIKLVLDSSIPSTPPTTKNEYKDNLIKSLNSLRASIDQAESMLNSMVNLDVKNEETTKLKTAGRKIKK